MSRAKANSRRQASCLATVWPACSKASLAARRATVCSRYLCKSCSRSDRKIHSTITKAIRTSPSAITSTNFVFWTGGGRNPAYSAQASTPKPSVASATIRIVPRRPTSIPASEALKANSNTETSLVPRKYIVNNVTAVIRPKNR